MCKEIEYIYTFNYEMCINKLIIYNDLSYSYESENIIEVFIYTYCEKDIADLRSKIRSTGILKNQIKKYDCIYYTFENTHKKILLKRGKKFSLLIIYKDI